MKEFEGVNGLQECTDIEEANLLLANGWVMLKMEGSVILLGWKGEREAKVPDSVLKLRDDRVADNSEASAENSAHYAKKLAEREAEKKRIFG